MSSAYKLKPFYGQLPTYSKGNNIGRLNRPQIAEIYEFTYQEVAKAYLNWMEVFRIDGSDLTFEQYLDKLLDAGLTPSDIGNKPNQYNLSRYDDEGSYTINSCRFITREENLAEQRH